MKFYNIVGDIMNLIICDDNAAICNDIKQYAENNFDCSASICKDEKSLQKLLIKNQDVQAIIMDIVLENDTNGIDLASKIHRDYPDIKMIFLTAYDDIYYKKIFSDFHPYGFITKPIQYNILNFFLRKISIEHNTRHKSIEFVSNYKNYSVAVSDIRYIQSRKRICEIVTQQDVFTTYLKISHIENNLTSAFIRCHQSYLVNMGYVSDLCKNQFVLTNGETVPISKKYILSARKSFELFKQESGE